MNHKLKWSVRFASTLAFAMIIGIPKQPVYATSSGCTQIGIFFADETCISVKGDGLQVDSVLASFVKIGKVCNWRYEIAYTDLKGKEYRTHKTKLHEGCDQKGEGLVPYKKPYTAKPGKVCARLYEDGSYLDAACVSITR